MTDHVWVGGAPEQSQVGLIILPADIESGQAFKASIGLKSISYTFPDGPLRLDVAAAIADLWNDSTIPEFEEITATDNGDGTISLTADEAGKPFVVSFVIGDGTNEIQVITLVNSPTGGTFTLDFDGQETAPIAYDASAATLQTALEALSNIGVGDVTVTGAAGGPWTVEFTGALADADVALLIGDATLLDGTNEEQTITLNSATGGTFTLTFEGDETGNLAFDASAATVETALDGLPSIGAGNVSVSGSAGGPYTITFIGDLAKTNVSLITIDGTNLTGVLDVTITETAPGSGGSNERHILQANVADWGSNQNGRVTLIGDASVTAGTWALNVKIIVNEGITNTLAALTAIPWNVTVAELQALIDAKLVLYGLDERYRVFAAKYTTANPVGNEKFSDGTNVIFQFVSALASGSAQEEPVLEIDSSGLTGGTFTQSLGNNIYIGDSSDYGTGTGAGSWRFIIDGNATDDLSPLITAADLKTAIEGLAAVGAGNVAVYQAGPGSGYAYGGGFVIEFIGDLSNQATGFTITTSKSAASTLNLQVWTGYTGSSGTGETQELSITGSPSSGTFGLSYEGAETPALAYNADAATIQAALEALDTIGTGNVICTGGPLPGTAIDITFAGTLTGTDLPDIEVIAGIVVETVEGGNAPSVSIVTTQTPVNYSIITANEGPNDWNTAENWDTGEVPASGDNVFILDGDSIWYGLDQSAVLLNRLETQSEDVQIGLPRRTTDYLEYRDRFLKIGAASILIGLGEGDGSDRINLDIGTTSPAIEVRNSGTGADGESAVQIIGVNAVNTATLLILGGEVAIADFPKQEAYFSRVTQRDGDLSTGSNVTIIEWIKTGGDVKADRTTVDGQATL